MAGRQARQRLFTFANHPSVARRQAVQAQPRGDRVEPRRELRVAPKPGDGAVDPDEYLLGEVLGLRLAAQHPERHAEDAMLVGDHQVLEGPRIALPEPVHQVGVIADPPFHPVRPYRPRWVPLRRNSTSAVRGGRVARSRGWAHTAGGRSAAGTGRGRLDERLRMLDDERAREFAGAWVQAWNAHDLDRIMTHYEDDVVLVSPVAARILDDPGGTVSGKAALRSYFQRGLDVYPNLKFELLDVMWGLNSVVLYYVNQRGSRTGEYMEFGPTGKVSRVVANYNG